MTFCALSAAKGMVIIMKEINPEQTNRADAFKHWMNAPMPMVTLLKTLDVSRLVKMSHRYGYKFNMLMCWCIGKAASQTEEFYFLPTGKKMIQYDSIAVNTIIATKDGSIKTCDIPYCDNFQKFNRDYMQLTNQVYATCKPYNLRENYMVIGTSTLAHYDIDGAINLYAGVYNNPFMIWGKYRKRFMKKIFTISFQFHHTQMDGISAARYLENLQNEIYRLNKKSIIG